MSLTDVDDGSGDGSGDGNEDGSADGSGDGSGAENCLSISSLHGA